MIRKVHAYSNIFWKSCIGSGTTTLYHMDKHGPGQAHPLRPIYRNRMDQVLPESAIWLTPRWDLVQWLQMPSLGKQTIHVYEVDNGLIRAAGGIVKIDKVPEVVFPANLWEEGLRSGKIKYKGVMSEKKKDRRIKEMEQWHSNWKNMSTQGAEKDELLERIAPFILRIHNSNNEFLDFLREKIKEFLWNGNIKQLEQLADELERGEEPSIVKEQRAEEERIKKKWSLT